MDFIIKLLPNVLLLQSWIPIGEIYFSGNPVSWCLADMIFFYVIFPIYAKLLNSDNGACLKKYGLWFIFLLVFYFFIMVLVPDNYCHQFLYISPVFRLIDFLIGMLMYELYYELKSKNREDKIISLSYMEKSFIELFLILFLTIFIAVFPYLDVRYSYAALWWGILPEFILYFALVDKSGGDFFNFDSSVACLFGGNKF